MTSVMMNVHESFAGNGQTSIFRKRNLLFHFNDTVHNNFLLQTSQYCLVLLLSRNYDNILAEDEEVYSSIKENTYNTIATSI